MMKEIWVVAVTDEYSVTNIKRVRTDNEGMVKYVKKALKDNGVNKETIKVETGRNCIQGSATKGLYDDQYVSVTSVKEISMRVVDI